MSPKRMIRSIYLFFKLQYADMSLGLWLSVANNSTFLPPTHFSDVSTEFTALFTTRIPGFVIHLPTVPESGMPQKSNPWC